MKNWRRALRPFVPAEILNLRRKLLQHRHATEGRTAQSRPSVPKFSFVVAVYNVAPYIDRFVESILTQDGGINDIEIILVNDGSTDASGRMADAWAAHYPKNITVIHQPNSGVSAARNAGLEIARGIWVSFADPDDFLDLCYMKEIRRETSRRRSMPLLAVYGNFVFFDESDNKFRDGHPLRYRFANGRKVVPTADPGRMIFLTVNHGWFRRTAILRHDLRFETSVKPSFEDGHFVNRLFASETETEICLLPSAKYYYRKRAAADSLIDRTKTDPAWYTDLLENGYLDLIRFSERACGSVPRFIQRAVLYDTFWKIKHALNNPDKLEFLCDDDRARFSAGLEEIFGYISSDVIESFELAGFSQEHRVALLGIYKRQKANLQRLYLKTNITAQGLVQFAWFTQEHLVEAVDVKVNGYSVPQLYPSSRQTTFFDKPYFTERFFWIPMREGDVVTADVDGKVAEIRRMGRSLGTSARWTDLCSALVAAAPNPDSVDARIKQIRTYSVSREARLRFAACWLLMDREGRADDNAEHLYRHLLSIRRATRAYFVLSRASADWDRLEREGFSLLEYGSDEHLAALANAEFLISSHADHFILWPPGSENLRDLASYKYVFLQHGVIKDDLSGWLNRKPVAAFITSTEAEFDSIAAKESPYIFSEKEVVLTGLPRHDNLLRLASEVSSDSIVVMPTWRLSMVDESLGTQQRQKVGGFLQGAYAQNWSNLIRSQKLKEIAVRNGLNILFMPHPNMAMYLEDFDVPEWVETCDARDDARYQQMIARARVMVTDYSSVAFDAAYLDRPVVYFQFDRETVFAGSHIYSPGYFSYEQHGFGPVCADAEQVLNGIEAALDEAEPVIYAQRRLDTFPFRDGRCCERVHAAIQTLQGGTALDWSRAYRQAAPSSQRIATDAPFTSSEVRRRSASTA